MRVSPVPRKALGPTIAGQESAGFVEYGEALEGGGEGFRLMVEADHHRGIRDGLDEPVLDDLDGGLQQGLGVGLGRTRAGGHIEDAEHAPCRGVDGRGDAGQEAVTFKIVLVAHHAYRALLGDGGADGVGAHHRFGPGLAGVQGDPGGLLEEVGVTDRAQDGAAVVGEENGG